MPKRKQSLNAQEQRKRLKTKHRGGPSPAKNTVDYGTLQNVYTSVQSLRDYFLSQLDTSSRHRRKRIASFDTDWPQHAGFLDQTSVGILRDSSHHAWEPRQRELHAFTQQTQQSASKENTNRSRCDTKELFQRQQHNLRRPDHLLCHGYDRKISAFPDKDNQQEVTLPGIFRQWSNPNVETFSKAPWPEALSLLGSDLEKVFCNLLLDCGLFCSIDSGQGNLFQLSGQPIFNIARSRDRNQVKQFDVKDGSSALCKLDKDRSLHPSQISFVRSRMFYARASANQKGAVKLGLKHIHVLNRYRNLSAPLQDLRLLQYVFPRQFGLHNVFTSDVNPMETAQPWKDYTVRDDDIEHHERRAGTKIPKRLRGEVRRLICTLKANHRKCSYVQLLYHYTQSPTNESENMRIDYSESGCVPTNQHLAPSINDGTTKTIETSFLAHATPSSNVSAFCKSVMRKLIPMRAFGSRVKGTRNWFHLSKMIDQFILARRFESFTLHEVVHQMKIATIDWLRPINVPAGQRLSMSDRKKRLELFHEFTYFLFDSILVPLVRSNFYVTETSMHRNRIFYFRHDIWRKISEPSLMTLRLNMFEPLNPRQVRHLLQTNRLGCSQVRLLPKEHGARPITNLRRRPMISLNGKRLLGTSINTKLSPAFSVLNFERERQPASIASALFSVGDIGRRLKAFLNRQPGNTRDRTLYFVKMDIKSCFDTIPQQQLLDLVKVLLTEKEYRLVKYVESKQLSHLGKEGKGSLSSKFVPRAIPQSLGPAFSIQDAKRIGSKKKGVLFSGTDHNRLLRSHQILQLVKDHIQENIVRIGRRHFRQIEGIPQGSVLSSLLCSFFYAKFEHEKLGFLDSGSSMLLRLIDDFLLITEDRLQAQMFVSAMAEGYAEYGICINAEKSLVNFKVSINGDQIPRVHGTEFFPYCGLGVHMKTLELQKDRLAKVMHVKNALTVDVSGRAVASLQRRIVSALKLQMHAMLLDTSHNGPEQIMTTLFECYVEATMKLHQYRITLPRSKRPGSNFIISLCQRMLIAGHKVFTSLPSNDRASTAKVSVFWIGSVAMAKVFARKQTEYGDVLRWLDGTATQARLTHGQSTRALHHAAFAGSALFEEYVY